MNWLVVQNIVFIFPLILGIIPTDFHSIIFQRGRAQPPTSRPRLLVSVGPPGAFSGQRPGEGPDPQEVWDGQHEK